MPRKLKTLQTSLGFYNLAIAAQSMKAALEAWGSRQLHQGFAPETHDPAVIRWQGLASCSSARPDLTGRSPSNRICRPILGWKNGALKKAASPKKRLSPRISDENARRAAAEFEREEKRRGAQRRREEAIREKERAKRERAVANARAALDEAQRKHEDQARSLGERGEIEKRIENEDTRWQREKQKLSESLRLARD